MSESSSLSEEPRLHGVSSVESCKSKGELWDVMHKFASFANYHSRLVLNQSSERPPTMVIRENFKLQASSAQWWRLERLKSKRCSKRSTWRKIVLRCCLKVERDGFSLYIFTMLRGSVLNILLTARYPDSEDSEEEPGEKGRVKWRTETGHMRVSEIQGKRLLMWNM